jgi:hypothetical protein
VEHVAPYYFFWQKDAFLFEQILAKLVLTYLFLEMDGMFILLGRIDSVLGREKQARLGAEAQYGTAETGPTILDVGLRSGIK